MRLNSLHPNSDQRMIEEFAQWVLDVGNGFAGRSDKDENDESFEISIPQQYCIQSDTSDVSMLIDSVFPDLSVRFTDYDYLRERAILTPRNKVVDHINNLILEQIPGVAYTYRSVDTAKSKVGVDDDLSATFPVEILNSMKLPGMPPHELKLKENIVVMLLRNINQAMGLCNGTRMVVKKCQEHSIVCEILTGSHSGTIHVIPRMEICPTDTNLPVDVFRLQFPVQVCFVMTINKAQGQSLNRVGLYLPESVFCHGQLYVAVSRVTSPSGLVIYIESRKGGTTTFTDNVVYDEVFYHL